MNIQQTLLSNANILYISQATLRIPGTATSHTYSEVNYVISGSGIYMVGENTYRVKAGDFTIVNAYQLHHVLTIDPNEPIVLFSVTLSVDSLPMSNSPVQPTSDTIRPHLLELIEIMRIEWKEKKPYYKLKVLSCFTEFIVTILRDSYITNSVLNLNDESMHVSTSLTHKEQKLLTNALLFIKQHYTENLSVQSIARNIPVSSTYLNRLFQKAMNISPMQYVIWLRLKKAVAIFTTTPGISVKEVAQSCGYPDPYHFSKLFKKHVGVTPTQYKAGKRVKKY